MDVRRLTAAEKGKGAISEPYQAPRKARVRVPEPANSYLLQKHSLTLIGRVTNASVQKVWSLLPFFTEKWATETRPVGSDLGQGMFQFQFEKEEDLLSILEKRPYRYAKWMVIVERWNPTTAPDFPSLIPFWIKVQGLPVHLWTEPTIKCIGEDLGIYEEAEITSLTARMRVQVNGRLPLIMNSVVEFPNGDEVIATLVYEGLDKHCTYCKRLDHEARECLKAKAEKREQAEPPEEGRKSNKQPELSIGQNDQRQSFYGKSISHRRGDSERPSPYDRTRTYLARERQYGGHKNLESRSHRDTNTRRADDRNLQWRRRPEGKQGDIGRSSNSSAFHTNQREQQRSPQAKTGWRREQNIREPSFTTPQGHSRIDREESSASKGAHRDSARGTPLQIPHEELPKEAMEEAIEELRGVMNQYTAVADPTESAARRERYRQAEVLGEIEETAAQMVRSKLALQVTPQTTPESPKRIPALLRLGPSPPHESEETSTSNYNSQGKQRGKEYTCKLAR
ncbi:hypothetical protein YC2023_068897 [Brassica napus]